MAKCRFASKALIDNGKIAAFGENDPLRLCMSEPRSDPSWHRKRRNGRTTSSHVSSQALAGEGSNQPPPDARRQGQQHITGFFTPAWSLAIHTYATAGHGRTGQGRAGQGALTWKVERDRQSERCRPQATASNGALWYQLQPTEVNNGPPLGLPQRAIIKQGKRRNSSSSIRRSCHQCRAC